MAWWTPWPYRLSALAIIAGVALERLPYGQRLLRPVAAAGVAGGVILLAQSVALTLYSAATARSHDLPGVLVKPLAGLCRLAGIDAAGDGAVIVVQSMRQSHRLAISWDMVLDPATLMFLVGGLAWIAIDAGRLSSSRLRWGPWGRTMARFALIVAAWLPVRAVMLLALYLHRAATSESNLPLHVMNQFLSPWVLLAFLVPPVLMAWRWVWPGGMVPLPEEAVEGAERVARKPSPPAPLPEGEGRKSVKPRSGVPLFRPDFSDSLAVKYLAAAACCLFGTILVALGLQWEPIGTRKAGRVMIVERHAPWSPSTTLYNTELLGGGDEERSYSYNYAAAYQYLNQYYDMSRLGETDAINEQTLSACDVLVIKIPSERYTPEEARAVVNFVEAGGGLLLIGDHTNLDRSSAHMNDIARSFGFAFRDDVLFSTQAAPDEERYRAPLVPHPALAHVPEFDFAVSCSIDPGTSLGRPVVAATGLWSMPGDYHMGNFMPFAQYVPETRFGSFIQAWSTRGGRGRVIAWGDSTIFSNFCLYQPGKAQVLLNLVEWLNYQGGLDLWWLWTLLGLGAIGNGLWLVRRDGSAWLVLVAAACCGWTVGSTAVAALTARQAPLPSPLPDGNRRLPPVVIDRTASQVPLASGAFNDDRGGRGFGLLEQAIPRVGCQTVRAEGGDVFQGDAVVMICPSRPVTEAFRKRLVEYVAQGKRLLLIDAGVDDAPSTSNQVLRPFGLALDYSQLCSGELTKPAKKAGGQAGEPPLEEATIPPGTIVDSAWQISGGTAIAAVRGKLEKRDPKEADVYETPAVCAAVRYGKGLVIVASFGNMFNDRNLGNNWARDPDPAERARYDVLFALLQRLLKDEPVVVPARLAGAPEPTIKPRLNRPGRRTKAQRPSGGI